MRAVIALDYKNLGEKLTVIAFGLVAGQMNS
jgi:hypothetical protein